MHTAHANEQEARKMVQTELQIYQKCFNQFLNIAYLSGPKSINEKFAGAEETYTLETYMPDGQMLQSCTAHYLGQNFAQAFGLKFTNHQNQQSLVYQTSAGLSTRIIGSIIMTHGDDYGLVLPFSVAPVQVTIVDITKNPNPKYYELIANVKRVLSPYRFTIDQRDKGFGYKMKEHEMAGTPFVIIIGEEEVKQQTVILVSRNNRIKNKIDLSQLATQLPILIKQYGDDLYQKSADKLQSAIVECQTWQQVLEAIAQQKIALAPWFNNAENETQLRKTHHGFGIRCLAKNRPEANKQCVFSKQPANCYAYFARSY